MLEPRLSKAIRLVTNDHIIDFGDGRYGVISDTNPGTVYRVRNNYCNCPDFAYRGYEPCGHLRAVAMLRGSSGW